MDESQTNALANGFKEARSVGFKEGMQKASLRLSAVAKQCEAGGHIRRARMLRALAREFMTDAIAIEQKSSSVGGQI